MPETSTIEIKAKNPDKTTDGSHSLLIGVIKELMMLEQRGYDVLSMVAVVTYQPRNDEIITVSRHI